MWMMVFTAKGTITAYSPTDLHKAIVALRESGIKTWATRMNCLKCEVELSGDETF